MKVPSETFPSAGLQRHVCDNPKCRKPIVIAWTGRDLIEDEATGAQRPSEYCSNLCLKEAEINPTKEIDMKYADAETTGTATQTAPETPKKKTATKGVAKGKAEKAAPKKKAAAKKGAAKLGPQTHREGSVAFKIEALLRRTGGATMKELSKISTTAQRSTMSVMRKRGVNVKMVQDKEGVRHYSI